MYILPTPHYDTVCPHLPLLVQQVLENIEEPLKRELILQNLMHATNLVSNLM